MRGITRREAVLAAAEPASKHSLVASAVEVNYKDLLSWKTYRLGRDEYWQRELWRLYDIVGEFRFAANWVGAMMSRVRIYVATVDERGVIGPETTDPEIQALADTMLGGPAAKAESLRLMGINITVGGEFYIVGKSGRGTDDDQWYIVTPSELTRWQSGVFYNSVDGPIQLLDNVDMIVRVWTPHPRWIWLADSPAHGAMNIITELERLTKYIFSQIDSRLVGGGLLAIPDNMDNPGEADDTKGAADTLMAKLAEAGMASLRGEGSATGVLPVIIEVPEAALGKLELIRFDTGLSEQAIDLRKEAIMRFAYSMDFPPEVITGQGSSNHWSAWYVDENAIKVHIEPPMGRVCDALTTAYLRGALKKLNKDPKRFTYWYDTAGLTARPTRLEDALNLYKQGLLSGDAVRAAGFFREDEAPSDEELASMFGKQLALIDPTQFANDKFRDMIGIGPKILPAGSIEAPPGPGTTPPPRPAQGIEPGRQPVPERSSTPPGGGAGTTTITSSAVDIHGAAVTLALVASSNLIVQRALEVAGGRLLTRSQRFPDTPKSEIHTRIRVSDPDKVTELLAGAWTYVPGLCMQLAGAVEEEQLTVALFEYCASLIYAQQPHHPDNLLAVLRNNGIVDG